MRKVARARELRRTASAAEVVFWGYLRGTKTGFKFRRQHPLGPYVLDFYCAEARLNLELDGEQHVSRRFEDGLRDDYLRLQNIDTLRIPTKDLLGGSGENFDRAVKSIVRLCELRSGRNAEDR